jgi:hypothetical protein
MYIIDDDRDWEDLYKRAKDLLQEARLALLAAESAMPEIEDELARIELAKNGVTWRHKGKRVLMNFKDAPNTPLIYDGISNGRIRLKNISEKTGKILKTGQSLSWNQGRYIRPAS